MLETQNIEYKSSWHNKYLDWICGFANALGGKNYIGKDNSENVIGVSIATCIIVLKKSKTDNATLFIDASKESVKSGNKEKLSDQNKEKILNAFIERTNKAHFARLVPNADIAANDYNIAVSSYVEQEDTREVIDIKKLNAKIAETVKRQNELRHAIDEIVNDLEGNSNE